MFSSQAYAQFDNHNGDGSRASFPVEVEDGDTYGISAQFVRGPNFGVVQVSIDGRPLGQPFDGYAAALAKTDPIPLGPLALSEGKHILTMTVTGKNATSTDYLAGLDLLILDSEAAPDPVPTAVATSEAGGTVPATLALTLGSPASFGAFQAGVAREYTASTTANIVSTAGDAALGRRATPGHLVERHRTLPQPLRVAGRSAGAVRPGPTRCRTTRVADRRSSRRSEPLTRCAPAPTPRRSHSPFDHQPMTSASL